MKALILALVAVVVIGGGGYLILHKSPSKTSPPTTSTVSNAPAIHNAVLITKTDARSGQYLADPSGKALYTYGADTSGVSNCTGSCLAVWPAYVVKGSTTNLPSGVGVVTRTDNSQKQYTYNGMPLYYFVSDGQGQVTGNGVQNFTVAKPSATTSSQSTSPAPSNASSAPTNSNTSSNSPY